MAAAVAALVMLSGVGIAVWRTGGAHPAPAGLAAASPAADHSAGLGAAPPAAAMGSAAPIPSASPSSRTTASGPAAVRGLIDSDDFTGSTVDTTRWGIYGSTAANGSIWSPSAVDANGGELQIVGTGTNATGKGNVAGGLCWCGTNGNRLYGKWQMRVRFDAGAGYGPNIGLWPQTNKGSDGYISAINVYDPGRKTLHGTLLWPGSKDSVAITGTFTAWHVFTIEWRATFVKLSMDGKVYYDSTKSTNNPVIPHEPLHLYLQMACGPNGALPAPDATTPAHVLMHIDWVRLYQ